MNQSVLCRLSSVVCLLAAVLWLASCGYAKHADPEIVTCATAADAKSSAQARAWAEQGLYEQNLCCGSMEPLIHAGDWLVETRSPFSNELLGRVCIYRPAWAKGRRIVHRFVSGDAVAGFIASGDNNRTSEPQERVTAGNYESEVIAIYKPAFLVGTSTP